MNGPRPLQTGFVKFVNQLQMASFGSFIGEVRWTIISLLIGVVDAWLLTRESEAMRATGLAVLGILVGSLVTKTIASVINSKNVRETSQEAMEGQANIEEAKARGKAIGELTAERAALPSLVNHADKVEQNVGAAGVGAVPPAPPAPPAPEPPEPPTPEPI